MPVIIRNKGASPLTLPFPFRGILPAGGSIRVNLTEAEALTALAISSSSKPVNVVEIRPTSSGGDFAVAQLGNALSGLLISEVTTATSALTEVFPVLGHLQQDAGVEVTAIDGPTKLSITTTVGVVRNMTHTASNTLRYDALINRQMIASFTLLISKVGGADFVADVGVAVNGTIERRIRAMNFTATPAIVAFECPLPTALTDTDEVALFADNTGGSKSANIQSATMFLKAS